MLDQSQNLEKIEDKTFNRVMQLVELIGDKEKHFNDLQTEYRKLASTWLLASLGACGYVIKSSSSLPYDHWYFVFGICIAASAGISILWMLDLRVYQKLLGAFFKEGFYLEMQHYKWLPPFRINIIASQKTGEIISKVQYYYFASISVLMALAIIALWNFKVFAHEPAARIICTIILASLLLSIQVILLVRRFKTKKKFNTSEFEVLLEKWNEKLEADKIISGVIN